MWLIDIYNLEFIDKNLRLILAEVEAQFGPGILTSLYRIGDKGVHGTLPLRGIDERCKDSRIGEVKVDFVNSRWIYHPDLTFNCALCHDVGQGLHIHYQTHPFTKRRS